MPRIEKSEDLKWVENITDGAPTILWIGIEEEQLTEEDTSRLLRLARLGALVEMAPPESGLWHGEDYHDGEFWEWESDEWGESGGMHSTPTAALEAAFGLDAGEGE